MITLTLETKVELTKDKKKILIKSTAVYLCYICHSIILYIILRVCALVRFFFSLCPQSDHTVTDKQWAVESNVHALWDTPLPWWTDWLLDQSHPHMEHGIMEIK